MNRNAGPLFVERRKYRRRRLTDAARILPVAGFVLLMLPMLWARGDGSGIAGEAVYLFAIWAALVLAAALLARPLGSGPVTEASPPETVDGPPWTGATGRSGTAGRPPPAGSAPADESGSETADRSRPAGAPGRADDGGNRDGGGGGARP